eukprot:evm.model.NODE_22846_length_9790_cov_28.229418.1
MNDLGGMDVLQGTEHLVQEKLHVVLRELLPRVDDPVQIRVHELTDDVHVVEICHWRRLQVQYPHNVLMTEMHQ